MQFKFEEVDLGSEGVQCRNSTDRSRKIIKMCRCELRARNYHLLRQCHFQPCSLIALWVGEQELGFLGNLERGSHLLMVLLTFLAREILVVQVLLHIIHSNQTLCL